MAGSGARSIARRVSAAAGIPAFLFEDGTINPASDKILEPLPFKDDVGGTEILNGIGDNFKIIRRRLPNGLEILIREDGTGFENVLELANGAVALKKEINNSGSLWNGIQATDSNTTIRRTFNNDVYAYSIIDGYNVQRGGRFYEIDNTNVDLTSAITNDLVIPNIERYPTISINPDTAPGVGPAFLTGLVPFDVSKSQKIIISNSSSTRDINVIAQSPLSAAPNRFINSIIGSSALLTIGPQSIRKLIYFPDGQIWALSLL